MMPHFRSMRAVRSLIKVRSMLRNQNADDSDVRTARRRNGITMPECPSAPAETPNRTDPYMKTMKMMLYGTEHHHHKRMFALMIDPIPLWLCSL